MVTLWEDLSFRGLMAQSSAGLREVLDGPPTSAYHGIDPTADSLHIGHLYGVCTLKRFQDHGHRPIALAGGGTGLIGDPGGRDEERPLLDMEAHRANMAGIRSQLERLLDVGPGSSGSEMLLLDNADWLVSYRLVDFLREIGKHFTVNQMVQKEAVRSRLERPDVGISYTEFTYMLLQACDFLHLYDDYGCTVQFGGSDQWGNITGGIDLIRRVRHAEAHGFTWPLLVSPEGRKYGKSTGNAVFLDAKRTSPFELYQHFIRVSDGEVGPMLRYLTFLGHEEIGALDEATRDHPERREGQKALAREVCRFVHGEAHTRRAETASAALYSEDIAALDEELLLEVMREAPSTVLALGALEGEGIELVALLASSSLSPSRGAARTAVEQGGAYVNNARRNDPDARVTLGDLLHGRYVVLRRGRRDYHLLQFE